jgi:hypothetical protein
MPGEWPGGPCPQCGDDMPPKVIHCQTCRALLNSELSEDSVEIPAFFPLPEIAVIASASPRGHYVTCPGCQQELRIHSKYRSLKVACKHCNVPFTYDKTVKINAAYMSCPHCKQEIRAGLKYLGHKVACRHCNGHLQLQQET